MCDGYAAMKSLKPIPRWHWTMLRASLLLLWTSTFLYTTIPDYGYSYSLFENLAYDPTGWLHEEFYIATFFLVAVFLTYEFEKRSLAVKRLRRLKNK